MRSTAIACLCVYLSVSPLACLKNHSSKLHEIFGRPFVQVAQLSQRDRATHELLRFAKLLSGIFEPPIWGLRGNVDASCVRRWKKRGRLPIGDN